MQIRDPNQPAPLPETAEVAPLMATGQPVRRSRVIGAEGFCASNPDDPMCQRGGVTTVAPSLTGRQQRMLRVLSRNAYANYQSDRPRRGARDPWTMDEKWGDCEDQVLAQIAELRRRDPALAAAARPVALMNARTPRGYTRDNIRGARRTDVQAHVVLAIETADGPVVLNVDNELPGEWDDRWEAISYGPEGMGAHWGPWQPQSRKPR